MTNLPIKDPHAHATRMLGYALTLGDDPDIWEGLALVLELRLSRIERARLLETVFRSTHPDDVLAALNDAFTDALTRDPLPVLVGIDEDARWWADLASPAELRAWLAACFVRLPHRDRMAFLETATRRAAA